MFKYFAMILVCLVNFDINTCEASATLDWNLDILGFSSNSKSFILAESVTGNDIGIAHAKIIITDITTNRCIYNGCLSARGSEEDLRSEEEVLTELYQKTWRLRKRLKLTPPRLGYQTEGPFFNKDCTTAYYLYNEQKIYVSLQQEFVQATREYPQRASVQLEVNVGNVTKTLDSLSNYRDYVQNYRLGRLLISPDKKNIAIVVHVLYQGFEEQVSRTLVQTAKLKNRGAIF